jgi:hypothetical protein
MVTMTEEFDRFYKNYFEHQLEWYDKKAAWNKRCYWSIRGTQIILVSFLPVAVSLFPVTSSLFWKNATIIAFVSLIIVQSLDSFLNTQKKWLNYRTTAEGLRREKQMFKTKTGEYSNIEDPEQVFIERTMMLTSRENRYWEITTLKSQEY